MVPATGRRNPHTALNRVVFPAPLGPMMPWISLASTLSETPSSASTPPKRTVRSATSSVGCSNPCLCSLTSVRQSIASAPAAQQGNGRVDVGLREPLVVRLVAVLELLKLYLYNDGVGLGLLLGVPDVIA